MQRPVVVGDTASSLTPKKNPNALIACYPEVFTGAAALILGLKGLSFGKEHPEGKGTAHAWVGNILGGLCLLANIAPLVFALAMSGMR